MAAYDVDDFSIVYRLCSSVKTEEDWDDIRVFLRSNPTEVTKACAEYQGELETSSLHVACKHNPPLDVIQALYEASPDTVEWIDAFVWLPLHYAAANGASAEVLSFLTNADPTSKVAVDKRGRTPLHFAVGTLDRQASKEVVEILSDSGAARCADENGSLPIHYACAYSSSVEVLKVLVEAVPQSSSSIDFNGCTPLHFAMGNCAKESSADIIKFLLEQNSGILTQTDNLGQLPLDLLAKRASKIEGDYRFLAQRENTMACLKCYLQALRTADCNADFLTAMQSLPGWLLDQAVILEKVQSVLNFKISQRFPTAVLILELYVYFLLILFFRLASYEFLDWSFNRDTEDKSSKLYVCLIGLVVGAFYFLLRELSQMIGLIVIDEFRSWYTDIQNLLDMLLITVIVVSTIIMWTFDAKQVNDHMESIKNFFSIITFILWLSILAFLKSTMIEFAVFVRGVSYVSQNLIAFVTALMIILFMFSQLFVTLSQDTKYCANHYITEKVKFQNLLNDENFYLVAGEDLPADAFNQTDADNQTKYFVCDVENSNYSEFFKVLVWDKNTSMYYYNDSSLDRENFCFDTYRNKNNFEEFPFCNFWDSFIRVNTMLFGEVNSDDFKDNFAVTFFFIFLLVVIILLANVLIAIVTDSYYVIRDQKAAIVFWNNRLDFVSEMATISDTFLKLTCCGTKKRGPAVGNSLEDGSMTGTTTTSQKEEGSFGKDLWEVLMNALSDTDSFSPTELEFWVYLFSKITTAFFIIPIWFLIGLPCAGILWPPQLRERVLVAYTKMHVDSVVEFQEDTKKQMKEIEASDEEFRKAYVGFESTVKGLMEFQK